MMAHPIIPGLGAVGLVFIILAVFFGLFITVLTVIAYWKICEKAGFPGPLSLLMLVPLANIVLLLYIAFAEWPALKQNKS